jgi:endonuclease/exonuclease/phosphatase family metal-dependent hydrolase
VYGTSREAALSAALKDTYLFSCWDPVRDHLGLHHGLLILSKTAIANEEFIPFEHQLTHEHLIATRGFMQCTVHIPGIGWVALVNLHATTGGLRRQTSRRVEAIRAEQITEVFEKLTATYDLPSVVAGSFYASEQASRRNYVLMQLNHLDAVSVTPAERQSTWRPRPSLLERFSIFGQAPPQRCDHVLCSKGAWKVVSAEMLFRDPLVSVPGHGMVPASDHCAVFTTLRCTADAQEVAA